MKDNRPPRVLPRGRVAQWSKAQIEKLSTPELRQLYANAQRLKEPELAATCDEILTARPHGLAPRERVARNGARRLVSRRKAFEAHGVALRNPTWSCGGIGTGGEVMLTIRADDVQSAEDASSSLLWAPNVDNAHPWSDSPGGMERLEHCRDARRLGTL